MPQDESFSAAPSHAWDQWVRGQYEKIIAYHAFHDARLVKSILRYLIENELKEKPIEITQEILIRDVLKNVGESSNVGHRVKEMRAKLTQYYADHPNDDLIIECPKGVYRLLFRPKAGAATRVETYDRHNEVECYFVGNNSAALEYELKQMPHLITLHDVHVRPRSAYNKYDEQTLGAFQQGINTFLNDDEDNRLELLVGQAVEKKYVETIMATAAGQEHKVRCFRLQQSPPLMNFCILYYKQQPSQKERFPLKEVLFGWGRYGLLAGESVFRSSDSRLVQEFENLYKTLIEFSDLVSITQLSESISAPTERPTITERWSQARMYHLLQNAPKGSTVRILDTVLRDDRGMPAQIEELLERNVNVYILLMNHENTALVEARFGVREDDLKPLNAVALIQKQIATLLKISTDDKFSGKLEVKQSNLMPFGFFFQCGEKILFGLFPPLWAHDRGPMIEVTVDSPLGKTLMENWDEAYWKYGIKPKVDDNREKARESASKRRK